jgi:hypothetical protein
MLVAGRTKLDFAHPSILICWLAFRPIGGPEAGTKLQPSPEGLGWGEEVTSAVGAAHSLPNTSLEFRLRNRPESDDAG